MRIAHAPTDRGIKSTAAFLEATDQLKAEGHAIEVDLIEGVTWAECLARKAKADVYFDQVKLGYGNNAIEAWGMGIPVIAGGAPPTLEEMERRFGNLPFYNATEDTLYAALRAMLDEGIRDEYAQRGQQHVERFHDERLVVEQLKDIYRRAAG
jgi:glycosyltransferase involved in cell wall biosynthesis